PQVREAARLVASGELGKLVNISGTVWQNWKSLSNDTWRVKPDISGGGFLFDTGAHMLNTICTLAGEDFTQVAAWLDNSEMDVDINGAVVGKLASGAMVTINATGDTIESCESEIMLFLTEGIIHTGQWGERLSVKRTGDADFIEPELEPMRGAWEQFMQVRRGEIENPCPPQVGLRMAKLWDAIQKSASLDGQRVDC
ncbi:MAG: Gfo/Idh/MocA family protein, partial [Aggregatilineales bacterium]